MRIIFIVLLFACFSCKEEAIPINQELDLNIKELLNLKNENTSSQSMTLDHRMLNAVLYNQVDNDLVEDVEKVLGIHRYRDNLLDICDLKKLSEFNESGKEEKILRLILEGEGGRTDIFDLNMSPDSVHIKFFRIIVNKMLSSEIASSITLSKHRSLVPEFRDFLSYYLQSLELKNRFDQGVYTYRSYSTLQTFIRLEKTSDAYYNETYFIRMSDFEKLESDLYKIVYETGVLE